MDSQNVLINGYLCFWVNHQQDNWYHFLPMAEFMHNSWHNKTTRTSPYQTLMGYNPAAEWQPITSTVPAPINQLEQWKWARELAEIQMQRVQNHWVQVKCQGQTFREGGSGLVGRAQTTSRPTISQISSQVPWTLPSGASLITNYLLPHSSYPMEDPPSVPCGSTNSIQGNRSSWPQLHQTTPRPNQRRRRI